MRDKINLLGIYCLIVLYFPDCNLIVGILFLLDFILRSDFVLILLARHSKTQVLSLVVCWVIMYLLSIHHVGGESHHGFCLRFLWQKALCMLWWFSGCQG